ncbi:GntR family transcriptional regulator [Halomonas elongata]|uniref:GntR family transcriptional regulator n=1 Tax=Halomonas elongata TaxID=2746 RepID=UPI00255B2F3E|nr:GntR family transcriptional regulator [Halomonas elongata]MDL4864257.1 GntR family transcriptional regulator [Halomonas elongata]
MLTIQQTAEGSGVREDGRTVADAAKDSLREMILTGHLCPGERVHQDHLSNLLGLSRTPVRAALASLAQDGLLDYESNRGYRVKQFSVDNIRGVFEVRASLEALACRVAAKVGVAPSILDRLDELVVVGDRILSAGKLIPDALPEYRKMNVEFHETIMESACNPLLKDFVDRSHNVPLVSDRVILWDDFDVIYRSHDDHRRIVKALRLSDGERAAALMHEHVYFAGELLVDRLQEDPNLLQHQKYD